MCSDSDVHDCLTALLKSSRLNVPCMRRSTLAPLQCAVQAACTATRRDQEQQRNNRRAVRRDQEHHAVIRSGALRSGAMIEVCGTQGKLADSWRSSGKHHRFP